MKARIEYDNGGIFRPFQVVYDINSVQQAREFLDIIGDNDPDLSLKVMQAMNAKIRASALDAMNKMC